MQHTIRLILGSLIALMVGTIAQAGIVLTAVRQSVSTDPNVIVNLYASYDNVNTAGAFSDKVFSYRFDTTITGVGTGVIASTAPGASVWSTVQSGTEFGGSPEVINGVGSTTIRFGGSQALSQPPANVQVGTGSVPQTLLSTISFAGTIGSTYSFGFTSLVNQDTGVAGFGYSNAGNAKVAHAFNAPSGFNLSITAVPEPSSLALCGLVAGLGAWRARRKQLAK